MQMVRITLRPMKRPVARALKVRDHVVLSPSFDGKVQIQCGSRQTVHGQGESADQGVPVTALLEEAGDRGELSFEVDR